MTLKELYSYGKKLIGSEAELLCQEFLKADRKEIIINPDLCPKNPQPYLQAVEKRHGGFPLQYILGHWQFDGLDLRVSQGVLIPREDTLPLVIEAALFIGENSFKGLDLCSGTGAVALALANRCKNVKIEAVELFEEPLECLKINVNSYGLNRVSVIKDDVLNSKVEYEELDFIVSNPPYIETGEINKLQVEVRQEPHEALNGGADGLKFYRSICQKWSGHLKKGGLLAVEIGESQGEAVKKLFTENGFVQVEIIKDFNSLPRVVKGIRH